MKNMILLEVGSGNAQKVEAQAFSKTTANIYITAETPQAAAELLQQGIEKALEACQNWKPEPQKPVEEKPQKHYRLCPVAVEDLQQTIDEYQQDERGSRFIRSIQKAKDFTDRKDTSGGLLITQLRYLCALTYMDVWDGLTTMYDIAYRRGFNRAKTERTAKKV